MVRAAPPAAGAVASRRRDDRDGRVARSRTLEALALLLREDFLPIV
jgi:hypothetical protein